MKKILILFLLTGVIYSGNSQSMKFDWITQIGSTNWDVVTSLTELSDGKIAIAGAFYDSITIAGKTYFSNGSRDCFIAIFDQHGEFTNTITLGGDGYEYIRNLLPAENGGLSAVLQYNDKLQTGGHTFPKKGQNNYAFVFFDKNLNIGNKTIIGSNGESKITGYEKSSDGSYYFTGWFEDSLLVDNKYYVTKGDENVFAGSIAKEAKMNWFKHYEANGFDRSFVSKADKSGKNYMVGITGKGEFEGQKKPKTVNEEFTNLFVLENSNEGVISGINYPVYGHEIEPVGILNHSTNLWILANFKYSAFVNGIELKSYGMSDILLLKINQQTKETNYYHFEEIGNEIAA